MALGGAAMAATSSLSLGFPLPRVPPARPIAHNHPISGLERCCYCLLESSSGVARHDGDPLWLPLPVFIIRAEGQLVLFGIVRAITFRKVRHGPRRSDRVVQACADRPRFYRGPQRLFSVGVANLVNHVCGSSCPAMRRRAGSG